MIVYDVRAVGAQLAFRLLRASLRRGLAATWARIGARMVDQTVRVIPTISGQLAGSLAALAGSDHVDVTAGSGIVYAGVQNYGWPARNIPAKGFMDQSVQVAEEELPDELSSEVQRLIRRVGLD